MELSDRDSVSADTQNQITWTRRLKKPDWDIPNEYEITQSKRTFLSLDRKHITFVTCIGRHVMLFCFQLF